MVFIFVDNDPVSFLIILVIVGFFQIKENALKENLHSYKIKIV